MAEIPENTPQGSNRVAAELTIRALGDAGRLDSTDAARIAALQALADSVDAHPDNASLWREYRAAEASLREIRDDDTDDLGELLSAVSATARNAPKR